MTRAPSASFLRPLMNLRPEFRGGTAKRCARRPAGTTLRRGAVIGVSRSTSSPLA